MEWTAPLSAMACLALVVKLVFFSYSHRQASKGVYRVVLFLVTVYAGKQVIDFLYLPDLYVHPLEALFHLALFLGALVMKPRYLPGNCK